MSQGKERTQTGPPQPEQAVAAATTQTGPGQESARHMRTTDDLRAGQAPPAGGKPTPAAAASAPPDPADLVRTEGESVPPPDRTRP
jgi:hypothetical protein